MSEQRSESSKLNTLLSWPACRRIQKRQFYLDLNSVSVKCTSNGTKFKNLSFFPEELGNRAGGSGSEVWNKIWMWKVRHFVCYSEPLSVMWLCLLSVASRFRLKLNPLLSTRQRNETVHRLYYGLAVGISRSKPNSSRSQSEPAGISWTNGSPNCQA